MPKPRNPAGEPLTLTLLLRTTLTLTLTLTWSGSAGGNEDQKSGCPPGVECQHGHCPGGNISCVCDEGWAGFQCEQQCPEDCLKGLEANGVCQTTPEGIAYCFCEGQDIHYIPGRGCISLQNTTTTTMTTTTTTATSTARVTEGNTSLATTTTLLPLSERTCVPGFACVHGRCVVTGSLFRCECLKGWTGTFCQDFCPKNCSQFGMCHILTNGTSVCRCGPAHTGELCEVERTRPTPLPANTSTTTTSHLSSLSTAHPSSNNSTNRSLEKRTCVPGFVCVNGYCLKEKRTVQCVCDKGWVGALCNQVCDLDCGLYGQCFLKADGKDRNNLTMICTCVPGYTGPRCNIPYPDDRTTAEVALGTVEWSDPTSLKPISERECVPGFVCVHGRCQENGIKCVCDEGYMGEFCHQRCPIKCSVHGQCLPFKNGTVVCSCNAQYTGDDCSQVRKMPELTTEDVTVQWYVVGACAGLLLVLMVLLVALPYWMWKRGHILVMKIVYHFKPFEDDDKKKYDAFISYSTVDEQFVVQELFPKLTAMRFTVCVHRKDFLPGETIANNIIEAVENSRRTILVLTPHFIRSQFCRFEYQQAQYQMIQQKHRIVPIVLQDVSQEKRHMDATLKSILNTITYLDWPLDKDPRQVDKFWKRLEFSMPKRKSKPESASGKSEPAIYSRLDSNSSGYSTASAYSTTSFNSTAASSGGRSRSTSISSFTSASGKPTDVHSSSGRRAKKNGSISRHSTSSRKGSRSPSKHGRKDSRASESKSRSKSRDRTVRPELVSIDLEQGRRETGAVSRRHEFLNPAYALP